ncbi:hypothetical protein QUF74_11050 [Candidatus Halobeggiatoa sp. HSG11]|nr:hypothetical protein [Candidatus Halobeggiatoa sp. HSG11]
MIFKNFIKKSWWLPIILINMLSCSENNEPNQHNNTNVTYKVEKEATEVHIGVPSKNLPPYFIYWNRKGMEHDILHEAFQNSNYKPIFSYIQNREEIFLKNKSNLDCISTVTEKLGYDGFYSHNVITYQDVAIYLKDSGLNINSKIDLADKKIEAFNDANKYLDIKDIVANNPFYYEHSGKASQILLLYRGKVDVLLMDKYLFFYFRNKVKKLIDMDRKVEVRPIFSKHPYQILCKDKKIRDDFNYGLSVLYTGERHQQIVKKYTNNEYLHNEKFD